MPSIPSFLRSKPRTPPPPSPITTYYLSSPSSSDAVLRPIPAPGSPRAIPQSSLIFSFTHPPLDVSEATLFFLECIPDPIGFLYHSSSFISRHLTLTPTSYAREGERGVQGIEWRHQLIQLELEDNDGLAATSGGKIVVSLKWVGDILNQVNRGQKGMEGAIKEFKGVLLHELVHTIQHDGFGTTPGWLIESIADYVRLCANLGPDHWRKSGSGRVENGWEDGYDIGARFLEWLVGSASTNSSLDSLSQGSIPTENAHQPTKTTIANQALQTQYPNLNSLSPNDHPPPPTIPPNRPNGGSNRPGPFPEFIKLLDSRLKFERFHQDWWIELTGLSLEDLWKEYLRYYGR